MPMVEKAVKEFYGESVNKSPDYCRIVSDRHMMRLKSLLDQTKGKVVFGGQVDPEDKYMSPTVVTDVTLDDDLEVCVGDITDIADEVLIPLILSITDAVDEGLIGGKNIDEEELDLFDALEIG